MSGFLAYIMPIDAGRPDQGLPGMPVGPSQGPGFPTNPIAPGGQPPGIWPSPGRPDQGLPGSQPGVSNPIVIPPNGIEEGTPSHPIVIPNPGTPTQPIHIPPELVGPPGSPGVPTHPIRLPPLVPTHPISGVASVNYVHVYAPGIGGAWLYIGGKPDQGLPEGGSEPYPDQGLPPEGSGGGSQPSVDPRRRR